MKNAFSSKIGILLAAAGSAVGLGSIWKFPYVVGENGGGAFIILYIVCSLIFGLPLVMNEFQIGKLSGKSAYGAYRTLSGTNRWQWLSWTNLLCVLVIMSFYQKPSIKVVKLQYSDIICTRVYNTNGNANLKYGGGGSGAARARGVGGGNWDEED